MIFLLATFAVPPRHTAFAGKLPATKKSPPPKNLTASPSKYRPPPPPVGRAINLSETLFRESVRSEGQRTYVCLELKYTCVFLHFQLTSWEPGRVRASNLLLLTRLARPSAFPTLSLLLSTTTPSRTQQMALWLSRHQASYALGTPPTVLCTVTLQLMELLASFHWTSTRHSHPHVLASSIQLPILPAKWENWFSWFLPSHSKTIILKHAGPHQHQ